jgi:hypothetical protein
MAQTPQLKRTQLRELYEALLLLKEQEQTALAELHAADPARLVRRFEASVATVAAYPAIVDPADPASPLPFHDRIDRKLPDPQPDDPIERTEHFASRLAKDGIQKVADAPELDFRYVDREIFPLRTTAKGAPRAATRRLDLLLASADGLPIAGELKIGSDKPTYFALIQALMYAAELSSAEQLNRLAKTYTLAEFAWPDGGPFLDVFVIALKPPTGGRFRKKSFEASKQVSCKLVADPRINSVIRRIAYLEAIPGDRDLSFVSRFHFPNPAAERP